MMNPNPIDFHSLRDALVNFKDAIKNPPANDPERDGVILRFEYTFELCWKSIRKLLLVEGRSEVSSSPKPLFRDAHQEGLIDDIEAWFGYIDARNRTSHTYNKKTADQVYKDIKNFAIHAKQLIGKLNARIRKN